jgi:hypothetical protein
MLQWVPQQLSTSVTSDVQRKIGNLKRSHPLQRIQICYNSYEEMSPKNLFGGF